MNKAAQKKRLRREKRRSKSRNNKPYRARKHEVYAAMLVAERNKVDSHLSTIVKLKTIIANQQKQLAEQAQEVANLTKEVAQVLQGNNRQENEIIFSDPNVSFKENDRLSNETGRHMIIPGGAMQNEQQDKPKQKRPKSKPGPRPAKELAEEMAEIEEEYEEDDDYIDELDDEMDEIDDDFDDEDDDYEVDNEGETK